MLILIHIDKTIYNSWHNLSTFSRTRRLSSLAARLQLSLAAFSIDGPTTCSYRLNISVDIPGISMQAYNFFKPVHPMPLCIEPATKIVRAIKPFEIRCTELSVNSEAI